jgi:hypothetical protein
VTTVELDIDVTEAAGLGVDVHTCVTVTFSDSCAAASQPIVAFAWPGGGYNRNYYLLDLPGHSSGQAGWHAGRGWIFVACDHLGVGDSSASDPDLLQFEDMASINAATTQGVLALLAAGDISPHLPPIGAPVVIGVGQSRGASLVIVQQAHHGSFDGIAVLGYSAIHTSPKSRPGQPAVPQPWVVRGTAPRSAILLNRHQVDRESMALALAPGSPDVHPFAWCFHYDDVDSALVQRDMSDFPNRHGNLPVWGDTFVPVMSRAMLTPGVIASEAASVTVPVLAAFGERDVAGDPWSEPGAYRSCADITVSVTQRMGHMHNFASTREQLWIRIEQWASTVVERKAA